MTFLQYLYCLLYVAFYRINIFFGLLKIQDKIEKKDLDKEYINSKKGKFMEIFDSKNTEKNLNISNVFYNKQELQFILSNETNSIEKLWKSRILYENTPRGNIIMYYDAYKMWFSYYCDQNVISYDILNAVAMKYVTIYRCLHFFLDENIVPSQYSSPLIPIYFTETDVKKEIKSKPEKHPFIKRKSILNENTKPEPERIQNKFIYLGKVNNFQWIQPTKKEKRVLAKFTSPLMETIIKESGVQRETMNYNDYKNKLKPLTIQIPKEVDSDL